MAELPKIEDLKTMQAKIKFNFFVNLKLCTAVEGNKLNSIAKIFSEFTYQSYIDYFYTGFLKQILLIQN